MKKKLFLMIGLLAIVIGVMGITFVSCGGEGSNSIQAFLRSIDNIDARSIARSAGPDNEVEFHVMQLLLNMDNQPYAGWIIRSDNHPDYPNNNGWYDIDEWTPELAKKIMFTVMEKGISFDYNKETGDAKIMIGNLTITPPFQISGPWPTMKERE